jgi:tRNA U34 5-methylaminomethyl-2-thiouridine-forming methyltransferase MnmC
VAFKLSKTWNLWAHHPNACEKFVKSHKIHSIFFMPNKPPACGIMLWTVEDVQTRTTRFVLFYQHYGLRRFIMGRNTMKLRHTDSASGLLAGVDRKK